VNELVLEGWRAKTRYDIIIVAEGAKPAGYAQFTREQRVDSFGHKALGGIGEFLADEIQKGTGLETRWVVLSHLQRGGVPCAYDRRMGRYFGIAAMNLVMMRDFGKMVCYKNGRITACPLEKVIGKLKYVDVKTMYDVERYNGRRSILGRKNKMYRDHGGSQDEMTSAEQSGNTRLRKGVSATSSEVDTLVENAVFGADEVREHSREKIRQFASAQGVVLASIDGLYRAAGKGLYTGITVPAINIRGITYQVARAVFRAALKDRVGAFIFEIARSEIGYTAQKPGEYAACVLAAAVTEGFRGPVFLQGDHFQVNRTKYNSEPERELVGAGFLNIDIDASTIVDLEKSNFEEQQKENCKVTADITKLIRGIEPEGITISVGGEIGEVGGQNSTVADLRAFIIGYLRLLGPNVEGLSKISVQTGTTHGGVILPDGSMASVDIDFKALKELSRAARKEYGMGGAVQHGASTLPDEAFDLFPQADTLEVHLATGFQNIVFDSPYFPKELLDRIYRHLQDKYASEMKQGDTSEQFLYKTRKKAFGDFKKELWDLSGENLRGIGNTLEERFSLLFRKLKVADTMDLVGQFVDY
jgi:fructose/tagatose bisphosphate aldolase